MKKITVKRRAVSIIVSLIVMVLYGLVGILGVPSSNSNADFSNIVYGYYIIGILFLFIITLININTIKKDFVDYFKHFFKNTAKVLIYLIIVIIVFSITRILTYTIMNVTPSGDTLITSALKTYPFYIVFVTIIYTPYVEEMIFRKSLSDIFKNKYLFITISACIFGYIHVMSDFSNIVEFIPLFVPIACFGGVLAYSYRKTNNIFIPVFIHLLYNSFVFLTLL